MQGRAWTIVYLRMKFLKTDYVGIYIQYNKYTKHTDRCCTLTEALQTCEVLQNIV